MPALLGKEGQSKTIQFRDFSEGLVRAGSRSGIPDTGLWSSENAQIIGPGQIATLPGPGASIATLSPAAASIWGVVISLSGVASTRIIVIRSDGAASSIDPGSGAVTAICAAGSLSSLARVTMWRDTHVLFADPTEGFASWDGTNFVVYPAAFTATLTSSDADIEWTAGTPASAIVAGMAISGTGIPVGTVVLAVVGTTITMSNDATASGSQTVTIGAGAPTSARDLAVFEGRVWLVTNTRGLAFSGPASFTGFSTAYAGGVAVLTDPVFPGQITRIVAAMQILWVFGTGAINTISNVQVVSGVTTFQDENLVAGIGSPYGDSIQPLFRTMLFLTPPGVYAILGATPQKLTDALDGLFRDVEGSGSGPAAVFTLNNILVYATLVAIGGAKRLLVYSRPTWLVGNQGDTITWITTVVRTTGEIEAWATTGSTLFQLFAGDAGDYLVESKLYDYGMFVQRKTVRRIAVEAEVSGLGVADLHVFLQNEYGQESEVGTVVPSEVTWINDSGDPVTWINDVAGPVTWIASGRVLVYGEAQFSGNMLGFKIRGTGSVPLNIGAIAQEIGAAGEWTFAP